MIYLYRTAVSICQQLVPDLRTSKYLYKGTAVPDTTNISMLTVLYTSTRHNQYLFGDIPVQYRTQPIALCWHTCTVQDTTNISMLTCLYSSIRHNWHLLSLHTYTVPDTTNFSMLTYLYTLPDKTDIICW